MAHIGHLEGRYGPPDGDLVSVWFLRSGFRRRAPPAEAEVELKPDRHENQDWPGNPHSEVAVQFLCHLSESGNDVCQRP